MTMCSSCKSKLPQGPHTAAEFETIHPAQHVETNPPVWHTKELKDLEWNVAAAESDYNECLSAFVALDRKAQQVSGGYQEAQKPTGKSAYKQACEASEAAWQLVEIASEKLSKARAAHTKLSKALEYRHLAKEYRKSQEEQEKALAVKAAAKKQAVIESAKGHPILSKLAGKLVGA
jgi:hypothetical protein